MYGTTAQAVQHPAGKADHKGQQIRLRGLGKEGKNGGEAGDLLLKVRIRRPFSRGSKRF